MLRQVVGLGLDMVLYLKTSQQVAIERLSGRRVCPECGKNYHAIKKNRHLLQASLSCL